MSSHRLARARERLADLDSQIAVLQRAKELVRVSIAADDHAGVLAILDARLRLKQRARASVQTRLTEHDAPGEPESSGEK